MHPLISPSHSSDPVSVYATLTELIVDQKEKIFADDGQEFLSPKLGYPIEENRYGRMMWLLKSSIPKTKWELETPLDKRLDYFEGLARKIVEEGDRLINEIERCQLETLIKRINKEWTSVIEENLSDLKSVGKRLLKRLRGGKGSADARLSPRNAPGLKRLDSSNSIKALAQLEVKPITFQPEAEECREDRWVANSYPSLIIYEDRIFYSTEIAYLAQKHAKNPAVFNRIALSCCSESAKELSKEAATNSLPQTPEVLHEVVTKQIKWMREIHRSKFRFNPVLKQKLLDTGVSPLLIQIPHQLWGLGGNGKGRNTLGLILELIRKELLKERSVIE